MTTDFERSLFVRGFNTLFSGTGKLFRDEGNALGRNSFSDGFAKTITKQGSLRLVLKFADALTDPVTVIAYVEFQNVIEIDRNLNVIYDFSVPDRLSHSSACASFRRSIRLRSSTDETETDGV